MMPPDAKALFWRLVAVLPTPFTPGAEDRTSALLQCLCQERQPWCDAIGSNRGIAQPKVIVLAVLGGKERRAGFDNHALGFQPGCDLSHINTVGRVHP
jgi:hypothetical protein